MSHVVDCDLTVTDLDEFAESCEALGLELVRNQTTHKWYGVFLNDWSGESAAITKGRDPETFGKCEHAVRVKGNPNAYEIGLVARADGKGFDAVYDSWGSQGRAIEAKAGKELRTLKDEYGARLTMRTWKRQGYAVRRVVTAEGKVQVRALAR